jgi:hypothetical protein
MNEPLDTEETKQEVIKKCVEQFEERKQDIKKVVLASNSSEEQVEFLFDVATAQNYKFKTEISLIKKETRLNHHIQLKLSIRARLISQEAWFDEPVYFNSY